MTPDQQDRQKLALDWVTIWQSEMSAAAADRERMEAWSATSALWADFFKRALACMPASVGQANEPARPAASTAPAGAAASADAPDARERALARLAARVDELERRLAL